MIVVHESGTTWHVGMKSVLIIARTEPETAEVKRQQHTHNAKHRVQWQEQIVGERAWRAIKLAA
jgi:hypothetical protein